MTGEHRSGNIRDGVHVFPLRVYYEDTDAGGVVYHANYLRFAERARTEFMRLLGGAHSALRAERGLYFTVRRCEAEYIRPARLDDALDVHTRVIEVRGASMWVEQTVVRDGDALARLRVRLALVDAEGRPARFPDALRRVLEPFSQPELRA